jgi:hypothetical protein
MAEMEGDDKTAKFGKLLESADVGLLTFLPPRRGEISCAAVESLLHTQWLPRPAQR